MTFTSSQRPSRSISLLNVNEVIRRLGEAGLQIDINKSKFYITKTKYLDLKSP